MTEDDTAFVAYLQKKFSDSIGDLLALHTESMLAGQVSCSDVVAFESECARLINVGVRLYIAALAVGTTQAEARAALVETFKTVIGFVRHYAKNPSRMAA